MLFFQSLLLGGRIRPCQPAHAGIIYQRQARWHLGMLGLSVTIITVAAYFWNRRIARHGPVFLLDYSCACASILLLAITNHVSQEIAVIPFIRVLPLTQSRNFIGVLRVQTDQLPPPNGKADTKSVACIR